MMQPALERHYPARDLCAQFGVTSMTLWRWMRAGILPPPCKISGRNYWPESAVRALIDRQSNGGAA